MIIIIIIIIVTFVMLLFVAACYPCRFPFAAEAATASLIFVWSSEF